MNSTIKDFRLDLCVSVLLYLCFVSTDLSSEEIVKKGINKKQVRKIINLIDRNEYKRRQAPLGVKITDRGFGKDRRYPITNKYLH